jgi:hypothetical protein
MRGDVTFGGVRCAAIDVVNTWGSTPAERARDYDCDAVFRGPKLVLVRAVPVDAPAATVFRWLCQLRVAPYSYDWVDNAGRRSPQTRDPALERLEIGQRFATIFRLVAFEPGRSITIDSDTPVFGRVVITYEAAPVDASHSRIVAKLLCSPPPNLLGALLHPVLPAGDLVMMRRQLLNLKALAERDARDEQLAGQSR